MTKPLPEVAHLGPFTYRITDSAEDWLALRADQGNGLWGYTDHEAGTITLQPDVNDSLKRVILLHELLHACAFAGGQLDQRKRKEEHWVVTTAPLLMDAMQRSPGLAKYLFG